MRKKRKINEKVCVCVRWKENSMLWIEHWWDIEHTQQNVEHASKSITQTEGAQTSNATERKKY